MDNKKTPTPITDTLRRGDKIAYPSASGVALICKVEDQSEKDVLVSLDNKRFFIPKESVNLHAIPLQGRRAKVYVTQQFSDEDHRLVYLRYRYQETLLDRIYNWYCRVKGRDTLPSSPIPPKTVTVEMEVEV